MIGVFDCCREKLNEASRGLGPFINQNGNVYEERYQNILITFACPPNSSVAARSTLALDYFLKLRELADPYNGSVILPNQGFLSWQPDSGHGDTGEHLLRI